MNATQIDFLVGAAVGLLYMLYVLVRVATFRNVNWFLRLLMGVPVILFPVGGALIVHLLICASAPEPRDDRFLGCLGVAGACLALLAYASSFARFAVHDDYAFCFILLGTAAFIVFGPFFLRVWSAVKDGLLSRLPKWAILLAVVMVVNAVVHIGVYRGFAEYGVPRERSGRYYLETDDRPTREITEKEYYAFSGHFVRGTSAFFLAFLLVPSLFYLLPLSGRRAAQPAGGSAQTLS